ncbi:unnamed protein product [Rhizoctonia solani]|uniref:(2E,6E)-farnesyl diphosphate synthase n=1 Tax=Rhizoctonia solani TaxID=456999 RepID=A0A8H3H920_9AGAM|nr:unnamed protein product [Rhizoctonia solani]
MESTQPDYDNILPILSGPSPWRPESETVLLEPFTYLTSNPGKDMRSHLIEAFNVWLQVQERDLAIVGKVVSMLHNASLMYGSSLCSFVFVLVGVDVKFGGARMDDVEDDSQLRRGAPVVHKIYGTPQTINTANYVYFLAYRELFKLRDWDASDRTKDLDKVVTEELLNLHRGQGLDLFWRDNLECPTEAEYIEMVNNKTGGLFRIAIKLMMALSPVEPKVDYVPLVNLIGVYFQIRDDYMNLQSSQASQLAHPTPRDLTRI